MILRCKKCGANARFGRQELYKVKYERLECTDCNNHTKWYDVAKHDRSEITEEWNKTNPVKGN